MWHILFSTIPLLRDFSIRARLEPHHYLSSEAMLGSTTDHQENPGIAKAGFDRCFLKISCLFLVVVLAWLLSFRSVVAVD